MLKNPRRSLAIMPLPLDPPAIHDEGLLARYPFLPQGRNYILSVLEKNGVSVEDLVEAPWLEDIRVKGRLRLVDAVSQGGDATYSTKIDISTEIGRMTEVLSFLHAMLVVLSLIHI